MSKTVRNITACRNCRTKRIRCDRQFPTCGNCAKKDIECVSIDPGTGQVIGRSYVYDLEKQVEALKREVQQLKESSTVKDPSQTPSISPSGIGEAETINNSTSNGSCNRYISYKVLLMKNEDIRNLASLPEAPLPPVDLVRDCLEVYFGLSNIQLPIIHREYYFVNYLRPLYGQGFKYFPHPQHSVDSYQFPPYVPSPEDSAVEHSHRNKCLFFLNIILAISTSMSQDKYPLSISHFYQQQSLKYADGIWDISKKSDLANIEMMQSLLLLSVYSIMRPSNPGAWYLVGNSIRLLYDLNIHEDSKVNNPIDDPFLVDMKRRMFWTCFALDRQISMYFKKPCGIVSTFGVPFPSTQDDSYILGNYVSPDAVIAHESHSKLVTLQYIKLRLIQSDIMNAEGTTDESLLAHKLNSWYTECQTLEIKEYTVFNQMIFELNYRQTYLGLYKHYLFDVNEPNALSTDKMLYVFDTAKQIIFGYHKLHNNVKLLNYSWVSINNMFQAIVTYLYIIYNFETIRKLVVTEEINEATNTATWFLESLKPICPSQCMAYVENINSFKKTVDDLLQNERPILNADLDFLFDDNGFVHSMVGSVNSADPADFFTW